LSIDTGDGRKSSQLHHHELWAETRRVREGSATSYSLLVQPNAPFALVGLEWEDLGANAREIHETHHGWTVVEHPAVTTPTNIDLDSASPRRRKR
jgi:hypothetical protein